MKKLKLAFISYKADMFDSIESIAKVAMNDPDCDAKIISVPYYDKLPNGKPCEPKTEDIHTVLPVTDYRSYAIEHEKPDIIFTYNLYDDANRATSIHPDYYNKRLRNFTGLLVYIPYFVGFADIEKYLCVAPGTIYADLVFVQSSKARKNYIDAFEDYEREHDCRGIFGDLESKFIALGSPKFDKAATARYESRIYPDSWKDLIEPGGKKIVFYNLTIASALYYKEAYLKKVQLVFDYFRCREDVVLLFRPHPMLENTYKTMRRKSVDDYHAIIMRYKKEGFGIFDNTADPHRSIALADCYYGDWSSLVSVFGYIDKPILTQNHLLLSEYTAEEQVKPPAEYICQNTDANYARVFHETEPAHLHSFINAVKANAAPTYGNLKRQTITASAGADILGYCKRIIQTNRRNRIW